MINLVAVQNKTTLSDYNAHAHLAPTVQHLKRASEHPVRQLDGRTVWMVNSTPQGGGVAEILPKVVTLLRELGVDTEWAVINPSEERFFALTKRIHNLLHGTGDPHISRDDRELYTSVSRDLADAFAKHLAPGDILIVHDPQPAGMGARLADELDLTAIWRCHIGLDEQTPATEAGWDFLAPWLRHYDRTVFTLAAYVPPQLNGDAPPDTDPIVIHPGIDPLSAKNRNLPIHKLTTILENGLYSGLVEIRSREGVLLR